ncbi:MAG: DUF1080 domain-containing protein [Candidatus Latescibacteria bacterium]|nr:DUF1080 domain-containing protein [Candidatus Latescibacterota bacterium]
MKLIRFCVLSVHIVAFAVSAFAQEQPRVVTAPPDSPPSDAVVLFNGSNLDEWMQPDGNPSKWTIEGDAMVMTGGGNITRKEFGDIQLHLEFATPSKVEGEGQGRGNSGVYLQGAYEVQVLDSYENETYPDGMLGAVYKQYIPLVNAARRPGEWQTYDMIFRAPKLDAGGNVVKKAVVTVILNGVLIQDHVEIDPTPGGTRDKGAEKGPIFLQDHSNPVRYRNIWVREL